MVYIYLLNWTQPDVHIDCIGKYLGTCWTIRTGIKLKRKQRTLTTYICKRRKERETLSRRLANRDNAVNPQGLHCECLYVYSRRGRRSTGLSRGSSVYRKTPFFSRIFFSFMYVCFLALDFCPLSCMYIRKLTIVRRELRCNDALYGVYIHRVHTPATIPLWRVCVCVHFSRLSWSAISVYQDISISGVPNRLWTVRVAPCVDSV